MIAITFLKETSRPLRLKYYEWKRWNQFSENIKNQGIEKYMQEKKIKYINKPGIAFSFDDSFRVDGWYNILKELFGYYDVKATFNVNAFHHFEGQREHTQDEIDKLLELQANGHEIAHHTYKHNDAVLYAKRFGVKKWLADEIEPLFNWLEKQQHSKTRECFKKPVSFAFPYFVSDEETVKALANYFRVVRGGPKGSLSTPFNETGFIPSIDIDSNLLSSNYNIKKILKNIKKTGSNLIFTCHSVLEDDFNWNQFNYGQEAEVAGRYRVSPKTLKYIIDEAKKHDLEFYTTAEISGAATFIDKNFESHIKSLLSLKPNQWILISQLVNIHELDLRNKEITNLDGLQYFLNLEKLKISQNKIKDLRLIEKLPKLKTIIQDKS